MFTSYIYIDEHGELQQASAQPFQNGIALHILKKILTPRFHQKLQL